MVAAYAGDQATTAETAGPAHLIPVTNPLERLNNEIKRRTDVVGIFPNEEAIVRLVGAVLFEQNDEWAARHPRYLALDRPSTSAITPAPPSPHRASHGQPRLRAGSAR